MKKYIITYKIRVMDCDDNEFQEATEHELFDFLESRKQYPHIHSIAVYTVSDKQVISNSR